MTPSHCAALRRRIVALSVPVLVGLAVACASDPAAPERHTEPRIAMAKPVGEVAVNSAKPDSAVRDTTLDVTINGSGFVSGSIAAWALKGTQDPSQVRTNSTRYVSSRELVANITISGTATLAKWDVMVMAGPKTGIGTEIFEIKQTGNVDTDARALIVWDSEVNVAAPGSPELLAPAGVQGDGRDRYGKAAAFSEYQGDFCGARAKIFWDNPTASGSGDLVFDPDKEYNSGMQACGAQRSLIFHLDYASGGVTGFATAIGAFSNARQAMALPTVGASRLQVLWFSFLGLKGCERIEFDAAWGSGTANVRVTRLADTPQAARQWRVESAYPHLGMCTTFRGTTPVARGTKYLPFGYTATEMPFPYAVYP